MSANIGYVTGTGTATSLDNPLVKILWSDQLHKETMSEMFFDKRGMMAPERGDEAAFERKSNAPIIVKDDFTRERGQQIRLALRKQLTTNRDLAEGTRQTNLVTATYGPNTMVGNEENMVLYDMEVIVELLKHAVAFDTPEIQNLRTNFRMDAQAKEALGDWLTDQKEESIVDAFVDGNAAHVIKSQSAVSAAVHPNKYIVNSEANDAALAAGDELDSAELRRMYAWARTNNINPLRADGVEGYVLLAPVFAINDLHTNTEYRTSFENAAPRSDSNTFFSRADHKYEGIYIHEYNRIRKPSSGANAANVHYCMLLGASALVFGNAGKPRLVRRKEDEYEDRYGVGIKLVFGCARADFYHINNNDNVNQSSAQWSVFANSTI